jgi:endonuclease/exonuclease/phosphatase (EEP) superfamily protein YafD
LVNAWYIAPLYLPQRHQPVSGPACRAVSANVHTSNRDAGPFLEFIGSVRPDVILAMEVDDRWQRALEQLLGDYPFSVIRPRPDNFGIALLSRHPIISQRVESLDDSGVPTIIASIDCEGRPLNVVGTHPLPPVGARRTELRNQHLEALGELVAEFSGPVVVLGDLNTTSWSPRFHELLQQSGLRDSRQGFGVQPTWPTAPWVLRIPIDHALISRDLFVKQRFVGRDIGSDHLPIVITIGVERAHRIRKGSRSERRPAYWRFPGTALPADSDAER